MLSTLTSFQFNLPFSKTSSPKTKVFILFPAINEKLAQDLKQTKELASTKTAIELFQATQYIYQTEPHVADKERRRFEAHESYDLATDDLFLVEITLFKEDARFAPNVNGIERYDAFADLIHTAAKVQLLGRLQMDSYNCLDWYIR